MCVCVCVCVCVVFTQNFYHEKYATQGQFFHALESLFEFKVFFT